MSIASGDAVWAEERVRRAFTYWSWLVPLTWMVVMKALSPWLGRQMAFQTALIPLWAIAVAHSGYFAWVLSQRRTRGRAMSAVVAVAVGACAWWWSGTHAGISCALGVGLVLLHALAVQPPGAHGPLRIAAMVVALRPLALLVCAVSAWVLFMTLGGSRLPPLHALAWWSAGAIAMALALVPSLLFLLVSGRIRRDRASADAVPVDDLA